MRIEEPYEGYFADRLIKLSQDHFERQAVRTTRVVKVAHMGRVLARRRGMEKEAIGPVIGGLLRGLGSAAKVIGRGAGRAGSAVSRGAGQVGRATSRGAGSVGRFAKDVGSAVKMKPIGVSGVAKSPGFVQSVGQTAGRISNAAQNSAIGRGAMHGLEGLTPNASMGEKVLNTAGRYGRAAITRRGPDLNATIGGSVLGEVGGDLAANLWGRRGGGAQVREMLGSVKGMGTNPISSVDDLAQAGFGNLPNGAVKAFQQAGVSPQQLSALENLHTYGGNLPGRARKQLESIAGTSYKEISGTDPNEFMQNYLAQRGAGSAGQVTPTGRAPKPVPQPDPAKMGKKPSKKELKEFAEETQSQVEDLTGDEESQKGLAGRLWEGLNTPVSQFASPNAQMAMTAAKIGLPIAGGLGLYGAYQGMNNIAAQNQGSQFQYGSMGAPINYGTTGMFPAGFVG